MFYSTDLLTSQTSGLSTLWLISTLGLRPSSKKLTKRDIQSTELPKVCQMIVNPSVPLALRLSSNLLYGASLVFKHQTDYLYSMK